MHREEVPNLTMNNLVATVKATGRIGVVGVFVPEDPNAEDCSRSASAWPSTSARSHLWPLPRLAEPRLLHRLSLRPSQDGREPAAASGSRHEAQSLD